MTEIIYRYVKGKGWVPGYEKPKRTLNEVIERELRRMDLDLDRRMGLDYSEWSNPRWSGRR